MECDTFSIASNGESSRNNDGWRLIEDLGLLKVQSSICFGKGIQDFLEVI